MILPFYFKRMSDGRYLISNPLRRFQFVDARQFNDGSLVDDASLRANKFIIDESQLDETVDEYRRLNAGLFSAARLHIFVLTLACNLECLYCQAEYNCPGSSAMSVETAERAVDFALASPDELLNFEFQGGEPLLNFTALRTIVEYTNRNKGDKSVQFSLVTNGQAMTDDILEYLIEHEISVTFSIDGPKYVHDKNRPTKDGSSNFDRVMHWFTRAKHLAQSRGERIRALPTITRYSLPYAREIVDFYCELGVPYISIRALSPFGRMTQNQMNIGYSAEEFIDFYRRCMDHLIDLNLDGRTTMRESMSAIILCKLNVEHIINYPDLRSPCGAAIGQVAYNWNGDVYTCDEGRMMSNIGLQNFRLGNVYCDSYKDCLQSEAACTVCNASCLETNPSCAECVYNAICGICPVYSLFTQDDYVGVPIKQERCKMLRGMYDYLLDWLNSSDEARRKLCRQWMS
ncbi:MAG: His-Xaa-Ser system radical SAM maturase HxsB [Selenomonadaceae bacterium]|nr:His-Xaa-Ser system radical SAM maturase HxsB [Selenomonadaceae bacterium]